MQARAMEMRVERFHVRTRTEQSASFEGFEDRPGRLGQNPRSILSIIAVCVCVCVPSQFRRHTRAIRFPIS